jgi:hypothetical protein
MIFAKVDIHHLRLRFSTHYNREIKFSPELNTAAKNYSNIKRNVPEKKF